MFINSIFGMFIVTYVIREHVFDTARIWHVCEILICQYSEKIFTFYIQRWMIVSFVDTLAVAHVCASFPDNTSMKTSWLGSHIQHWT